MINLIPPSAKKGIMIEYWLRVISVWFFCWSGAFLLGVFITVPAYVLLSLQVNNFSESAASASQKIADYDSLAQDLTTSSEQARVLVDGLRNTTVSKYIALFRSLESNEVRLSHIMIAREKDEVAPIQLQGEARNRQALAAFRDRLLAQESVASVDLPISNLAKDRDIQFSISVTIKKPTP